MDIDRIGDKNIQIDINAFFISDFDIVLSTKFYLHEFHTFNPSLWGCISNTSTSKEAEALLLASRNFP